MRPIFQQDLPTRFFRRWPLWVQILFFLVVFNGIFWMAGVFEAFNLQPSGYHTWRQADCAGIAYLYHEYDVAFFEPEVLNQNGDFLESGRAATSEAPILYYAVAVLYSWFGFDLLIHRILVYLIFLSGIFFLWKTLARYSRNFLLATFGTILFATSPFLLDYSNSFLSNICGLSMALGGVHYGLRWMDNSNNSRLLLIAAFFFTLGGLFKVTALLAPISLLGVLLIQGLRMRDFKVKSMLIILSSFIFPFLWIVWAKIYNQEHLSYYFSTQVYPIWQFEFGQILKLLAATLTNWTDHFFPLITWLILAVMLMAVVYQRARINRQIRNWVYITGIGAIVYSALQFEHLSIHDYYFTNLFIVPAMLLILTVNIIPKGFGRSVMGLVILGIISALIIVSSRNTLAMRDQAFEWDPKNELVGKNELLDELGVPKDSKIIFGYDDTNVSLFHLRRRGWTQYGLPFNLHGGMENSDEFIFRLQAMVKNGAQYLVTQKTDRLKKFPELDILKGYALLESDDISVYQIDRKEVMEMEVDQRYTKPQ